VQEFLSGLLSVIRNLSDYTVPITAVCAFLAFIIKPVRNRIIGGVRKISRSEEISKKIDALLLCERQISEQIEVHEAIHLALMKDRIVNLYFKYINSQYLPSFEKQNLVEQYALYKKLGGNGYLDTLYGSLMNKRESVPGEINGG
jgi:hypothetical protein